MREDAETMTEVGSYRVDAAIGEGGMAQVFRVWNESLQRAEALKLLSPKLAADREFVKRFLREAQTAAKLQHPNIATIYAVSPPTEAQPYFTMELLDGVDLADLLSQRGGRLSEQEAIAWLKQVAAGLDYAHSKGVIHRDIKPANVLVTREGVAKLVDFGIARAAETSGDARLTQTGMIVGTPDYMSPEQARGDAEVTPASDQYSLACVAFELLIGHPPFPRNAETTQFQVMMHHVQTPPPDPGNYGVSPSVSAAILRSLSKASGQRFASCQEFVEAMLSSVPALVPIPPPAPVFAVAAPPTKTGGTNYGPALVVIALAGVGLIGYSVLRPSPPSPIAAPNSSGSSGEETPTPTHQESVRSPVETLEDYMGAVNRRGAGDAQKAWGLYSLSYQRAHPFEKWKEDNFDTTLQMTSNKPLTLTSKNSTDAWVSADWNSQEKRRRGSEIEHWAGTYHFILENNAWKIESSDASRVNDRQETPRGVSLEAVARNSGVMSSQALQGAEPEMAWREYCGAVTGRHYLSAWNLKSKISKKNTGSSEKFIDKVKGTPYMRVLRTTQMSVEYGGEAVILEVEIDTGNPSESGKYKVKMVKEDGFWKVESQKR